MRFILGKKANMDQVFDEKGNVVPVTLIQAGPCFIVCVRSKEKDGYEAVQVGFEQLKEKKVKKPQQSAPYRYFKEIKGNFPGIEAGQKVDLSSFKEGDEVKISGISKGKGFAGVVKKWAFGGRSPSHGTKHEERTVGSVGCRFPQRVIKGKKMPGRMGGERVTVKNLKIIKIDKESNLLAVKGAVPGRKGSLLEIKG